MSPKQMARTRRFHIEGAILERLFQADDEYAVVSAEDGDFEVECSEKA